MRLHYACLLLAFLPLATPAHAYPAWSGPEWRPSAFSQPYSRFHPWDREFTRHRHTARHGRAVRHYRVARQAVYDRGQIVSHPSGCPSRQFCGCGASVEVFGRPVRELWLAANWLMFPRTSPAPGMAVVFGRHHVAIIRQYYGDGTATLYDANSGRGLTRVHRVRIAGLTVVNPRGNRRYARN